MSRRFGTRGRRGGGWSGGGTEPPPPQYANMIMWLDPTQGITESGGLVSAWASRVGAAVFSAAGAARPAIGAGYVEFDGTDDYMSRTADAQSHPVSQPVCSWGAWVWRTLGGADRVVFTSVPLFTASGGVFIQDGAASRQYYVNNAGSWNRTTSLATGSWVFRSVVYDSTLTLGSRTKVYEGATPGAVALVAATTDTSVGNTGVAGGTSCIGRDAGLGRYFSGRIGHMGLWSGAALTLAELQAFSALTVPP